MSLVYSPLPCLGKFARLPVNLLGFQIIDGTGLRSQNVTLKNATIQGGD